MYTHGYCQPPNFCWTKPRLCIHAYLVCNKYTNKSSWIELLLQNPNTLRKKKICVYFVNINKYMDTCVYTHTHIHTHTHTYIHTHVPTHMVRLIHNAIFLARIRIHLQMYVHICISSTHTYTYTDTDTQTYTMTYTHMCTHTYTNMCIAYTHTHTFELTAK